MGELGGGLIFAGLIPFKTEDIPMFIATHPQEIAAALAATMLVTTASIIALLLFKKLYREVVMEGLSLRNLTAGYNSKPVFMDLSLEVPAATTLVLMGVSGEGEPPYSRLFWE